MNYYRQSSSGGSEIVVNIVAGSYAYTKSLTIDPPRGSSGNSNPDYYIADVEVSRNSRNKL